MEANEVNTFYKRLKESRANKKLSQRDLAEQLGRKASTISSWESEIEAQRRVPNFSDTAAIADILDVDLAWLITGKVKESGPEYLKMPRIDHCSILKNPEVKKNVETVPCSVQMASMFCTNLEDAFLLKAAGGHLAPLVNPGDLVLIQTDLRPVEKMPSNCLWVVNDNDDLILATYRFEDGHIMFKTTRGDTAENMEVYGRAMVRVQRL